MKISSYFFIIYLRKISHYAGKLGNISKINGSKINIDFKIFLKIIKIYSFMMFLKNSLRNCGDLRTDYCILSFAFIIYFPKLRNICLFLRCIIMQAIKKVNTSLIIRTKILNDHHLLQSPH